MTRYGLLLLALLSCWLPLIVPAQWPPVRLVERLATDPLVRAQANATPHPRLVLVDIDEASLQALGPWPWPRARLAELVESALAAGATRVALDILLPEPAKPDEASVGDLRLAALAAEGNLVLAAAFDFVPRPRPLQVGALSLNAGIAPAPAVRSTGYMGNHDSLAASARCMGNIGFIPDSDGALRQIPARVLWRNHYFRSLAESLVYCGDNSQQTLLPDNNFWKIPYRVSNYSWHTMPAYALLQGAALPEQALVIIGSSALSLGDRVATPLSPQVAGFLVHAQAANALLQDSVNSDSRWMQAGFMALSSALISWLFLALWRARRFRGLLLPALVSSLAWLVAASLMVRNNSDLPLSGYWLGLSIWLCLAIPSAWASSQRKLAVRARILSRYVSDTVLQDLLQDEQADPLTPQRAFITVLIADLANFTQLTNTMPLEEAAQMTRDVLECLSAPIWETRGTLDKYLGDGVLAFWGAPLPDSLQAQHALTAAERMLSNLNHLNSSSKYPLLQVRIGIATGSALVGDLGTRKRSTYSAIGDCVNLASRLEGLASHLQKNILLCPETAQKLGSTNILPLGNFAIKGLGHMNVYTLN